MHFREIRRTENNSIVEDWYMCTISGCKSRFMNCDVANGNDKLTRHLKAHQNEKTLSMTQSTLIEMLSCASALGKKYGQIDTGVFRSMLSTKHDWTDYMQNIENYLERQAVATPESVAAPKAAIDEKSMACYGIENAALITKSQHQMNQIVPFNLLSMCQLMHSQKLI